MLFTINSYIILITNFIISFIKDIFLIVIHIMLAITISVFVKDVLLIVIHIMLAITITAINNLYYIIFISFIHLFEVIVIINIQTANLVNIQTANLDIVTIINYLSDDTTNIIFNLHHHLIKSMKHLI